MLAASDDRTFERLAADEAREGKRSLLFIALDLELANVDRRLATSQLPVNLPATLVIAAIVQEFAVVAKPTKPRLFVILANVGLVVPPHGRPDIGRCSKRSLS